MIFKTRPSNADVIRWGIGFELLLPSSVGSIGSMEGGHTDNYFIQTPFEVSFVRGGWLWILIAVIQYIGFSAPKI